MPFYVGDWLKCPEVRALPPDARGLWFDLICFMWESTERGVMVKPNGKAYSDADIIRMVGLDNQNSGIWLTLLLDNHVCSRREDGAIYSRKMVKDEKIRAMRREIGAKGGNPRLLDKPDLTNLVNQNTEDETEYENENSIKKEEQNQPVGVSHETKDFDTLAAFNLAFAEYPNKIRDGFARSAFFDCRWTQAIFDRFLIAIAGYKDHLSEEKWKKPMEFRTFLNEWEQWINVKKPEPVLTPEEKARADLRAKGYFK